MKNVLIAGCGDIGSRIGLILADEGHAVWGVRRNAAKIPHPITPVAGDLTRPASWGELPARIDWLIYAAAASGPGEDAYRAAYIEGLGNAIERARGAGVSRVLFTSSTSVYGQANGEEVDESSPTEPSRYTGRILLEAESVLAELTVPHIALRYGGIYGPGRTRLLDRVRDGSARTPRAPLFTNRIHADDAARAAAHLMEVESPAAIYNGTDCEQADLRDVYEWIAKRLGVPPPAPDESGATAGRGSKRVRSDLLRGTGFVFRYPGFREGYGAMIEDESS
ncbi:MAG: NAD-dependent epimerase/dehydratase family protein [Gemmatimonadetes bacterium]|nr:NAD-dependent epimerase/dehydratase family protein [Gemmatimonadota bacterium]